MHKVALQPQTFGGITILSTAPERRMELFNSETVAQRTCGRPSHTLAP